MYTNTRARTYTTIYMHLCVPFSATKNKYFVSFYRVHVTFVYKKPNILFKSMITLTISLIVDSNAFDCFISVVIFTRLL